MKSKTLTTTNLNSGNREKFNCAIEINGIDIVPLSINFYNNTGGEVGIIFLSNSDEEALFEEQVLTSLTSFGYLSVPNNQWLNQVNISKIYKIVVVKLSGTASTQAKVNLYHYSERV
jgi:hypothetical protein